MKIRKSDREKRKERAETPNVERCFIHSSRAAENRNPEKAEKSQRGRAERGMSLPRRKKNQYEMKKIQT